MKRKMDVVSLYHFNRLKASLPYSRLRVLSAFHEIGGKGTLFDIADYLNEPIHCISGRLTELKDAKLLEVIGREERIVSGKKTSCNRYETRYFKSGRKRRAA